MGIDLLALTASFRTLDDRESKTARFRTLVPWVGPEAYLNIVYKPATPRLLFTVSEKWRFPNAVTNFLLHQNGAMLFSGSLNLYGVVETGHLLNRDDRFTLPPFNIEVENASWRLTPNRLLVIGGYKCGGSRVCIDRFDEHIHVFGRKQSAPRVSWSSLEEWLTQEIVRLSSLFDGDGRPLSPESETGPP